MSDAPMWLDELVDGTLEGVTEADVAELNAPSGRLVACDPLTTLRDADAFAIEVKPGKYEVRIGVVGDDLAYSMLVLGEGKIARWEVARCPADDDIEGWPGYEVHSAVGCFVDRSTLEAFTKIEDAISDEVGEKVAAAGISPTDLAAYHEVFEKARAELAPDPLRNIERDIQMKKYASAVLDPESGANVVAFRAGAGEGVFASFWGLNSRGRPLRLVTDFALLGQEEEDEDPFEDEEQGGSDDDLLGGALDGLGELKGIEALAAALGARAPEPEERQGPSDLFVQTRALVDRWEKAETIELVETADRESFAEALLEKLVSLQGNPHPGSEVANWLLERREVVDVYASDEDINRDLTAQ